MPYGKHYNSSRRNWQVLSVRVQDNFEWSSTRKAGRNHIWHGSEMESKQNNERILRNYSRDSVQHIGVFCLKANGMSRQYPISNKEVSFQKIAELALEKDAPVYLNIDETVIEKKKSFSQAKRPVEGTGWHYSHLASKQVFGYQLF